MVPDLTAELEAAVVKSGDLEAEMETAQAGEKASLEEAERLREEIAKLKKQLSEADEAAVRMEAEKNEKIKELEAKVAKLTEKLEVRDPATWIVLQHDGPNHLGLRCNASLEHQMALITSDCGTCRR